MTACYRPEVVISGYWAFCQRVIGEQPMPGFGTCQCGMREDNEPWHRSLHTLMHRVCRLKDKLTLQIEYRHSALRRCDGW
jgi:hypothetical protein